MFAERVLGEPLGATAGRVDGRLSLRLQGRARDGAGAPTDAALRGARAAAPRAGFPAAADAARAPHQRRTLRGVRPKVGRIQSRHSAQRPTGE